MCSPRLTKALLAGAGLFVRPPSGGQPVPGSQAHCGKWVSEAAGAVAPVQSTQAAPWTCGGPASRPMLPLLAQPRPDQRLLRLRRKVCFLAAERPQPIGAAGQRHLHFPCPAFFLASRQRHPGCPRPKGRLRHGPATERDQARGLASPNAAAPRRSGRGGLGPGAQTPALRPRPRKTVGPNSRPPGRDSSPSASRHPGPARSDPARPVAVQEDICRLQQDKGLPALGRLPQVQLRRPLARPVSINRPSRLGRCPQTCDSTSARCRQGPAGHRPGDDPGELNARTPCSALTRRTSAKGQGRGWPAAPVSTQAGADHRLVAQPGHQPEGELAIGRRCARRCRQAAPDASTSTAKAGQLASTASPRRRASAPHPAGQDALTVVRAKFMQPDMTIPQAGVQAGQRIPHRPAVDPQMPLAAGLQRRVHRIDQHPPGHLCGASPRQRPGHQAFAGAPSSRHHGSCWGTAMGA